MAISAPSIDHRDPHTSGASIFERYRDFLLSRETIITFINGLLLILGSVVTMGGAPGLGNWLFLASALTGGIPLFLYAARGLIIDRDVTAGVMVSTAMIAAILVGEYSAAALVVFMMSIGEWLENMTVARADNALRDLASLIPATVTVRRNGQESVIPIEQVTLDDVVLVLTGERVGVDGVILAGTGSLNQAAITGESMPVEKVTGDKVFAGTLVEVGALEVEVKRLGEDTTLGQIVTLVKDAQSSKAPVERQADRYARYLVPLTFAIAIAVYLVTRDITRSITVLVVVCPCALVLATPTAVVAAIGNAAKHRILVKSGASMEQVGRVDVVAFDKTGTLTIGRPVVRDVVAVNSADPGYILGLAASAERFSEHPIGRSIVNAAKQREIKLLEPSDFTAQPGFGVTASVSQKKVVVGNRALLVDRGIPWSAVLGAKVEALEDQGKTVIPVAVDGEVAGLLALTDTPRPQAVTVIAELKRLGVEQVVMITGDNSGTAAIIAHDLGVDRFYAGVLPQDKLQIIRDIQAQGKKVAYAGDGVNDAPALAAADIGIAMGVAGTDVALETADIGLMQDEIERIPYVLGLSRRTLKVIWQNVAFSMSVNILSVLLGVLGIIGPVVGALMHELSALPVLANSARLINYYDEHQS
jgi:Cd2+/Zn2+-exporting ATPase